MFLGGGTQIGLFTDAIIQICALPLIVAAVFRLTEGEWFPAWRVPMLFLIAALALPLLQAVPLPPSIWALLPGRQFAVDTYQAAGIPLPWLSISLAPHATIYTFFTMIPAAALFLAAVQLDTNQRYKLLTVPLGLGAISVLFGLGQLFGPDPESITFYRPANIGYAVGFFANRNHYGAMLYALLPLAVAWTAAQVSSNSRRRIWSIYYGGFLVGALLVGLSFAYSRAGVALGVVAAIGSVIIVLRTFNVGRLGRWPIIIGAGLLLAFALLLQLGLVDLLIQRSLIDDARRNIARLAWVALQQYYLVGSGFGTFVPVFKAVETPADLSWYFINHAHNDWLEIVLEAGLVAAVLLVLFVVWFGLTVYRVWFGGQFAADDRGKLLASAASLTALLLLLHSTLDYPLRTTTLMSVFAVCCAFLCPGPAPPPEPPSRSSRSHRSRRSGA